MAPFPWKSVLIQTVSIGIVFGSAVEYVCQEHFERMVGNRGDPWWIVSGLKKGLAILLSLIAARVCWVCFRKGF